MRYARPMLTKATWVLGLLTLLGGCSSSSNGLDGVDASQRDGSRLGGPDGSRSPDSSEGGMGKDAGSDSAADATHPVDAGPVAPSQAKAAGYTSETFSSTFAESTVDTTNSQKSGFDWYLGQFFGGAATPASDLTFNSDGTLTFDGAGTSSNAGINTAAPSTDAAGWVGLAFGGGAYFEATYSFNPADTIATGGDGWPSWWAMAIEHLAGLPSEQWSGQAAGYDHFIETDFFEYDVWSFSPHNEYGGAMHDWYGIYESTCGGGYCNVSNSSGGGTSFSDFVVETPTTTDFTTYHAFGFLWVPATGTTKGTATYYFDGKATNDVVTWSQYTGSESPPPGSAPWTFGVLDQQHLVLILGTGGKEPMRLKSVVVWQKSAADNLKQ